MLDAITIHTQFFKQRLVGFIFLMVKILQFINPNYYNSEESKGCYGLSDYKILMFPGAPRPYKGVEDVLIALDKLNQPDLRLVIVGGSPYDNYDALIGKMGTLDYQLPKYPIELCLILSQRRILLLFPSGILLDSARSVSSEVNRWNVNGKTYISNESWGYSRYFR